MEAINNQKKIIKQDFNHYIQKGISYHEYKAEMAKDFLENKDEKVTAYIKLNQSRMNRVEKTYTISPEIKNQLLSLRHKTTWLIITEHWCGDASQNLPVFNAITEASNGNIEMKLVYRDQNPELMNDYLTNGSKSIPKLIQLDKHLNVTGIWGPRPSVAQKLVKELKSNPDTANDYAKKLHLWYANNKQKTLELEVGKLIFRANLFCPDCLS